MTKKLSFIHLTDLHIGQHGQWLWPNFKSIFIDDLKRLAREAGPIDLVIFSGDLTQKAEESEFNMLTQELKWIWQSFKEIGMSPHFFPVPGNHDLTRPNRTDACVKLLKQFTTDTEIAHEFWNTPDNQYIKVVKSAFKNYCGWLENLEANGIPLAKNSDGIIPGDTSASLDINGISLGLVGINTAFLQLGNEDFENKLSIDIRQLNALTENDPPAWCQKHDINFLITHHPPSWLSPENVRHFHSEIFPSNRFTAHFFGHMHNPESSTIYRGGDSGRRSFQGASLFGLEQYRDGNSSRIHGYSIGEICLSGEKNTYRLWPRKGIINNTSGDRRIVPDHENYHILPGTEYIEEQLPLKNEKQKTLATPGATAASVVPVVDLAMKVEEQNPCWNEALQNSKYSILMQAQHFEVRILQQRLGINYARQNKMLWVCADWGLGRNGFLHSIFKGLGIDERPVYRIDLESYSNRNDFFAKFRNQVGCSFQEYCKALTNIGPAVLLMDEAPVTIGDITGDAIEKDVEELASMIIDFCPEAIIVLLARTSPKISSIGVVKLEPLDEVDTGIYLRGHVDASNELRSYKSISEIFRHTEGYPGKIDRALKKLRVISLAELGPPNTNETSAIDGLNESVPISLVGAVRELRESNDPDLKRSYLLLTALVILPNGESLQRLKRLKHDTPIFPKHAEELLERDLIQVIESTNLIKSSCGNQSPIKILKAPRSVRDYVLGLMSEDEIDWLIGKATSLYFGEDWSTGAKNLKGLSDEPVWDDDNLLQNPHFLIMKLLASKRTWENDRTAKSVIKLCTVYCAAIINGKGYRNCSNACRDILTLLPESGYDDDKELIESYLAKSLRMTGNYEDAKEILGRLVNFSKPKKHQQSLLLTFALCLQAQGDKEASTVAEKVIKLAPNSEGAAQAKVIILEMQSEIDNTENLAKLERESRKKGFTTVANNLIINRSIRTPKDEDLSEKLQEVFKTSIAEGSKYNAYRAVVKLAELNLRNNIQITQSTLNSLIAAYQYFYGERSNKLFTNAHQSLWTIFELNGDTRNLLSLFRHSSFIWRLSGSEDREKPFIKRLKKSARNILAVDPSNTDQNTAYFLLRATGNQD